MKRSDILAIVEDVLVELGHIEYGEISEQLSLDDLQVDAEDRLFLVTELNDAYFPCSCGSCYCISWLNLFRFHTVKDVINEVLFMMS